MTIPDPVKTGPDPVKTGPDPVKTGPDRQHIRNEYYNHAFSVQFNTFYVYIEFAFILILADPKGGEG